jgi:hypothetical protein
MPKTAFFAYPATPPFLGETITQAVGQIDKARNLIVTPWPKLDVIGLKIDDLIRDRISTADFLIADITYPNFNVYYEIGFAIGQQKPVVLTMDYAVEKAAANVNLTGLFDTIGQLRYQNAAELVSKLSDSPPLWANQYLKEKDHSQPLFLLDTYRKTDFRNYIAQSIINSSVQHRGFDPEEIPRLSLTAAIGYVSASAGVIVPLVSKEIEDWHRHNLRAAMIAGMSQGLGIEPLIIQYEDAPAPLDYRDFIDTGRIRVEVENSVLEYCQSTLIRNQQRAGLIGRVRRTILNEIDIGSSAAENEFQKLAAYFVPTAEFQRANRSTGALVVGRKGSGKSAIFYQVAEAKAHDRRNLVIELNPASHSLSELRQELLGVVSLGVFDHTIAAFWQYILYAEILLKLREILLPKARYELRLLKKIDEIERRFKLTDEVVAGDFTSRLELAVRTVVKHVKDRTLAEGDIKQKITNILFESDIPSFRTAIADLGSEFQKIVLLFDNLDKGWPARQVEAHDIRTVHHLIDALNKMERELRRSEIDFEYLLFLRSDVYENLVQETSDRGKYNVIRVDWSDTKQLENLIQQRVIFNVPEPRRAEAWNAVNPTLDSGATAISQMIASSLMRPRFLIDLCEKAISFAVNRGHESVTTGDVESALEQHSLYLVSDFGYEIRDVAGITEDIFYRFIGLGDTLTADEVRDAIGNVEGTSVDRIVDLLLWYGFLGVPGPGGRAIYIFDRDYDMRRLDADRRAQGADLLYVVNPAFLMGLKP